MGISHFFIRRPIFAGVIAIIITIMVLELKVPHGADLAALRPLLPTLVRFDVAACIFFLNSCELL